MSSEKEFKGRKIVLTGISRGIGLASGEELLKQGAEIIGVSRNKENINTAKEKLAQFKESLVIIQGDIADPSTAKNTAREVSQKWGSLDILINCAGIQRYAKSFEEEEESCLEETLKINVLGLHYFIRELIPYLRKGQEPRIINFSSGAGMIKGVIDQGAGDMGSYRLSKLTVNGLTMIYANHLKEKISVLSFDPGWIKTDLGGPQAPEETPAAVDRIIATLKLPWDVTGKFYKGSDELPW